MMKYKANKMKTIFLTSNTKGTPIKYAQALQSLFHIPSPYHAREMVQVDKPNLLK